MLVGATSGAMMRSACSTSGRVDPIVASEGGIHGVGVTDPGVLGRSTSPPDDRESARSAVNSVLDKASAQPGGKVGVRR
jgi:hypothetical protein